MAADALRLQACLWTDPPHWLDLTRAAMAVASAPVICADAIDGLTPPLPHVPGQLHLIFHTIASQYFSADRQALGRSWIKGAEATATDETTLAWLRMEAAGSDAPVPR